MNHQKLLSVGVFAIVTVAQAAVPVSAATGIQVGRSGKSYASSAIQCALHPTLGMSPLVYAGLYNPKRRATATVSLNDTSIATVNFYTPETQVWLDKRINTVAVSLNRRTRDTYTFDATSSQLNICIPNTSGNTISGDLEFAASSKSYTGNVIGCAWNPATQQAQPFVNLFDNGTYLLNVSINGVPLTQLNGTTRKHTPVFLSAGLNVISAANGPTSTDYYVRDGGTGTCTLP